ncbi:NAD(P)(+) transhydrogenase (Re/Si-specific) subunit beta [Streptomyces chartreusis]|uniref:NAD(P)(+) transhydrogenase (Re/Si-specific) subunit beta n=1 Tax=Streptomyces chartreusis TaxID=1969 RepID=UPI00362C1964
MAAQHGPRHTARRQSPAAPERNPPAELDAYRICSTGWLVLVSGGVLGAALGLWAAREVQMTAMPQLVSPFIAVGGGTVALIGLNDLLQADDAAGLGARVFLPGALDIVIGAVTFAGSLIAAGKLQGVVSGAPVVFPGARLLNVQRHRHESVQSRVGVGRQYEPDGAGDERSRQRPGEGVQPGDDDRHVGAADRQHDGETEERQSRWPASS